MLTAKQHKEGLCRGFLFFFLVGWEKLLPEIGTRGIERVVDLITGYLLAVNVTGGHPTGSFMESFKVGKALCDD